MNKADFHAKCRQVALRWLNETKRQTGYAIVHCNIETNAIEVTGWMLELFSGIGAPGCLAINNVGDMHEATGSKNYDDVTEWVQIVPLDEEPTALPDIPAQECS